MHINLSLMHHCSSFELVRTWYLHVDESGDRTPIGPILGQKLFFVTRHPLANFNYVNPFRSLDSKFWINYTSLFIIFLLLSLHIHIKLFAKIDTRRAMKIITSPEEAFWTQVIKSMLLVQCLISFTFWTFQVLFGIDLWSVLVGK